MAALIRHGLFANALKSTSITVRTATTARKSIEFPRTRRIMDVKARISSVGESLSARGFLRPLKSYKPPANASEKFDKICESQAISSNDDVKLDEPNLRFQLLTACEEAFEHNVPNSLLYSIENIGDLRQFYLTPVDSSTPYEALGRMKLPENLHIQQEYHRFHPDTDSLFGGKSAFPKSSTIIVGLKCKKKYRGYRQDNPFLHYMLKI